MDDLVDLGENEDYTSTACTPPMAGFKIPATAASTPDGQPHASTYRNEHGRPGPLSNRPSDRALFDSAIQALEAQIANVGAHMGIDASARQAYTRYIKQFSNELQVKVMQGGMTWREAAEQAHEARNRIMEIIRARSTPVGRAYAQSLKAEGKSLNTLIAEKTIKLFGPKADFNALSEANRNKVYAEVVISSGKSRPSVTATMKRLSTAGRALIVLSLAISVYNIAQADDKVDAAKREGAVTGAGILGGMAGGAVAGLACGPGAPVCVAAGAFIGGALAAFGVNHFW